MLIPLRSSGFYAVNPSLGSFRNFYYFAADLTALRPITLEATLFHSIVSQRAPVPCPYCRYPIELKPDKNCSRVLADF